MPEAVPDFDARKELRAFYERHYDELIETCLEVSSHSYRFSPLNTLPAEERRAWMAIGFQDIMRAMAGEQSVHAGRLYYPHISELADAPFFGMTDIIDSCECVLLPDEGILPLLWADYQNEPDKLYALVIEFRREQNNVTKAHIRQNMDDLAEYVKSIKQEADAERCRQIELEIYHRFYLALLNLREKTNSLYDTVANMEDTADLMRLRSEITQLKMMETDLVSEILRIRQDASEGADGRQPKTRRSPSQQQGSSEETRPFEQACLAHNITGREREVIELIAQGLTNAEISKRLSLADSTVKNYLSSILSKLGKSNRSQIVVFAATNGFFH